MTIHCRAVGLREQLSRIWGLVNVHSTRHWGVVCRTTEGDSCWQQAFLGSLVAVKKVPCLSNSQIEQGGAVQGFIHCRRSGWGEEKSQCQGLTHVPAELGPVQLTMWAPWLMLNKFRSCSSSVVFLSL